mmetsp:Transcript_12139/g.29643  ORF Transcript_12139/g.29643 Transcript_12139/m.29643 type:complete len:347 (-) Transcript_12139:120-1160(-)|eukprot:CAMPEP_0181126994 /NCGR_PEP_ID=MMETSP1071-20121207/27946_1 /TAXON_ID=35127 /ORGANISM="Thalassiosira sp., Strain NH16" /LENGTH=346 /DNA_ID=CAMNT_0023212673 /DNA_START=265 /DNA_END=1305 /DNA_ORIENTATION=+
MRDIRFLISLLLIGKCITEGAPGTPLPFLQGGPKCVADSAPRIPVPFLRGGSTAAARTMKIQQQRRPRKGGVKPIGIVVNKVKQGIGKLGGKIRHDTVHIGKNIGREWGKLTTSARRLVVNIPKILPRRKSLKSCKKLDEACHTFASVLRGDEIDTSQLLKACHAHLALMKSGGSALRLVAKDLESNVHKAEKVFKKSPKDGKCLSSLLECEKSRGIHNGNQLQEKSAAMGLLWIRRSLAFQLDLYASLIHGQVHPRDAAYSAYSKHLSPFHGWALRKVFPASLSQMPDRQVFIAKFGGIDLDQLNAEVDKVIAKKLKALVATWDPLISTWKDEFERLGLEDTRRV